MPTITTEVDVDVDLNDFDTDDLLEVLENRNVQVSGDVVEVIEKLHTAYLLNQGHDVERLMRELFYKGIGRIV
jgi:hypothetical protein